MTERVQDMNMDATQPQPLAGFQNLVDDSQRIFRGVLHAMAHPGKIVTLKNLPEAPAPLNKVTAAICMSLVDFETPVWTDAAISDSGQALTHLQFHCGCPFTTDPQKAHTALVSDIAMLTRLDLFCEGTDERPDLSTTVIVQVSHLDTDAGVRLTGPGIQAVNTLRVQGADTVFWSAVHANSMLFPRGMDLILTTDENVVCLPRTTQVEV